jgi:hypothetical protein
MNGRLEKQHSLTHFGESETIDYPVAIPAKKRVRFPVHLGYPYSEKEKPDADREAKRKYKAALEAYISDKLGNLDGFDLLDENTRYEIVFPSGWKKTSR